MTSDPSAAGGPSSAPSSEVELKHGAIPFLDALVVGLASTSPASSLAAVIGPIGRCVRRNGGDWGGGWSYGGTVSDVTPVAPVPDLVVRGLRKTYGTPPVRALRGVDLTVHAGEFVALMGPSGSGKSTLLHLVAGLDRADEGTVALAGVRTEELDATRLARLRRRHVGLVFQFFHLIEHLSARENVALAAMIAGAKTAEAEARARDLLDSLGLLDRADERPGALSGGQRQRVAIARALANRPTILLADEPTGALDSGGAAEVLDLFRRLHDGGQTILMVTHNREVAAGAQRIVRMRDGRVVDGGPRRGAALGPGGDGRGEFVATGDEPTWVDALTASDRSGHDASDQASAGGRL